MTLQCPLCHQTLVQYDRTFRCESNHQFDVAKEGYVNLIPAHHKRSKNPGDNTEMMQARRRFLAGGHYDQMRQAVTELCLAHQSTPEHQLLDIGCGEGYYTQHFATALNNAAPEPTTYGLDISKVAVRYAAKRYANVQFTVASSHRLPFSDLSLDTIVKIYAPCKAQELHRCLADNGVLITVTPAARHLYQLRESIYEDVRLHSEEPEEIDGFTPVSQQKIHYTMALSGQDALDLLQMTPFAWKATQKFKHQLSEAKQYECEADFMIRIYHKI
ncbi:23S rRNA (guanine(745)-N(1))-methyltransferase [Vibrio sp. SCSIO 43136]|uniref:23S rRNA (guanine(745)-N(1))-methyltransferase n=1 Tax=Vibrio sp. SCSIO 43136 TaxID=2819101 RepID=UPI00207660D7|nr:23S rRNA (guanine(745)-N(1))-methyltransferase [Vibrio sp. SCSIO 43136]USD66053.1 23S rRNA (guanine(745)-N(1))-methyltransferase [Vibrio sp. SCSIO 43136]